MLFKILHGAESRISTDITPFHEGYCYVTHEGNMYVDMNVGTETAPNNQRVQISSKDALTSIEAQALINQNSGEKVQLWVGTQAELDAIEERDANCVYFTTDEIDFDPNDVLLVTEQELTEEQKEQVQTNIGVMSAVSVLSHNIMSEGKGLSISYYDYMLNKVSSNYVDQDGIHLYHVSNSVVEYDQFVNSNKQAFVEVTNLETGKNNMLLSDLEYMSAEFIIYQVKIDDGNALMIVLISEDNCTVGDTVFPKKGIYIQYVDETAVITGLYVCGHDFRKHTHTLNDLPITFSTVDLEDGVSTLPAGTIQLVYEE